MTPTRRSTDDTEKLIADVQREADILVADLEGARARIVDLFRTLGARAKQITDLRAEVTGLRKACTRSSDGHKLTLSELKQAKLVVEAAKTYIHDGDTTKVNDLFLAVHTYEEWEKTI